jgi:type I restriction enzyme, S subunit
VSGWKTVRISEFCRTGTGGTPSRSNLERYYEGGTIPWVKSGELRETVIQETEEHVTDAALQETNVKIIPAGALLLAMYGATVGRLGILGVEATTNQAVCHIIPDPKAAEVRFLFYALCNQVSNLIARGVGGAQPNISQGVVKDLKLALPPLPEQRRIAEVLDRTEALRAKRRAALAQLDSLTQSLFLDLFGDPTTIQQEWPTKKLGELLDFLTSGSRGWAEHYAESGDLFLRIQNVRRDELLLEDIAYVKAPDTAEAKRTRVQAGDVLLSITADLGRTAVVPEELGPAFINQHLSILRTKAPVPRFLSAYFASPAGQRQVSGRNRQGVKAGLNFEDIRSFVIPVPPIEKQREFARQVQVVEKLKTAQRASLAELDALFASLQHRAFRGEL